MQSTIKNRTIFCHDNINILNGMNSESIDLIYLDPPFNKNKVFIAPLKSSAAGASFKDIFKETDLKDEWVVTIKEDNPQLFSFLSGVKGIGDNANYCYLCYMAVRLIECHRVLKSTGCVYLHCDTTMSHYLKIVMDCIFGANNFLNDIVWNKGFRGTESRQIFQHSYDTLFFYSKGVSYTWNQPSQPYKDTDLKRYNKIDENGKRYALIKRERASGEIYYGKSYPKEQGKSMNDIFEGIATMSSTSKERTGYPTQKPLELLERIIKVSSNEGDIVFDPFCGCATSCVAAERLGRKWVGIDISFKAYELVKSRLMKEVEHTNSDIFTFDPNEDEIYATTEPPQRTDDGKDYVLKKYIYVISNAAYPDDFKVGIASDVNKRLSAYQTSDPERGYRVEYTLLSEKFKEIETSIHGSERFLVRHEWITGQLKDIIKEIEALNKKL